ncbi:hypothetical protein FISHEDRAFT_60624 [Fistulina hepatica ATCC 64428]|uniref:Uncharacterized protein n=1 Tax=Fistulina hepatica ATCC 64428 TaxID=1128425 RepID=A0A0D7A896_9AGAR|nr:hypothetical protein FISHEDRAFT_60624 [Fistulina hepatica ATCC 64428]
MSYRTGTTIAVYGVVQWTHLGSAVSTYSIDGDTPTTLNLMNNGTGMEQGFYDEPTSAALSDANYTLTMKLTEVPSRQKHVLDFLSHRVGAIVGGVIGGVAALLLITLAAFWWCRGYGYDPPVVSLFENAPPPKSSTHSLVGADPKYPIPSLNLAYAGPPGSSSMGEPSASALLTRQELRRRIDELQADMAELEGPATNSNVNDTARIRLLQEEVVLLREENARSYGGAFPPPAYADYNLFQASAMLVLVAESTAVYVVISYATVACNIAGFPTPVCNASETVAMTQNSVNPETFRRTAWRRGDVNFSVPILGSLDVDAGYASRRLANARVTRGSELNARSVRPRPVQLARRVDFFSNGKKQKQKAEQQRQEQVKNCIQTCSHPSYHKTPEQCTEADQVGQTVAHEWTAVLSMHNLDQTHYSEVSLSKSRKRETLNTFHPLVILDSLKWLRRPQRIMSLYLRQVSEVAADSVAFCRAITNSISGHWELELFDDLSHFRRQTQKVNAAFNYTSRVVLSSAINSVALHQGVAYMGFPLITFLALSPFFSLYRGEVNSWMERYPLCIYNLLVEIIGQLAEDKPTLSACSPREVEVISDQTHGSGRKISPHSFDTGVLESGCSILLPTVPFLCHVLAKINRLDSLDLTMHMTPAKIWSNWSLAIQTSPYTALSLPTLRNLKVGVCSIPSAIVDNRVRSPFMHVGLTESHFTPPEDGVVQRRSTVNHLTIVIYRKGRLNKYILRQTPALDILNTLRLAMLSSAVAHDTLAVLT